MSRSRVVGLSLILCFGLSACMQGASGTQSAPNSAPRTGEVVEQDVEAPEVFSERDKGLWDGRPSLGGVWVAHPDVDAPERVIIRNAETGRETVGALFKRERMNPGPVFQVSAEAAEAVGMLAGAPTGLEVVALRTEEISPEPAASPEMTPSADAGANADSAGTDTPAPAAQPAPTADASAAENDETPDTLIDMPDAEEPRKRGFFARLFGRSERTEPEVSSEPLDATAPLDDAPEASGESALPMPSPLRDNASDSAATSALDRPFVQIGIFSIEANANGAAETMRDAGLSATIKPGKMQGNSFWRVVVGPARTAAQRSDLLAQVKRLGFSDAYAVRR